MTTTIPAQIVKKFKTPIVPVYIERIEDIKFKIIIKKQLTFSEDASTQEITDKLNAVELVNLVSTKVDGKPGGGRPDMAQSGGQNVQGVQNAINLLKQHLINR